MAKSQKHTVPNEYLQPREEVLARAQQHMKMSLLGLASAGSAAGNSGPKQDPTKEEGVFGDMIAQTQLAVSVVTLHTAEELKNAWRDFDWSKMPDAPEIIAVSGNTTAIALAPIDWASLRQSAEPMNWRSTRFNEGGLLGRHCPEDSWLAYYMLSAKSNEWFEWSNSHRRFSTLAHDARANFWNALLDAQVLNTNTRIPSHSIGNVLQQMRLFDLAILQPVVPDELLKKIAHATQWTTASEAEETLMALCVLLHEHTAGGDHNTKTLNSVVAQVLRCAPDLGRLVDIHTLHGPEYSYKAVGRMLGNQRKTTLAEMLLHSLSVVWKEDKKKKPMWIEALEEYTQAYVYALPAKKQHTLCAHVWEHIPNAHIDNAYYEMLYPTKANFGSFFVSLWMNAAPVCQEFVRKELFKHAVDLFNRNYDIHMIFPEEMTTKHIPNLDQSWGIPELKKIATAMIAHKDLQRAGLTQENLAKMHKLWGEWMFNNEARAHLPNLFNIMGDEREDEKRRVLAMNVFLTQLDANVVPGAKKQRKI